MIATREGYICLLRKNWLEGKCLIQLTAEIVDMVLMPGDNFIVTATSDNNLQCLTKKVCTYLVIEFSCIIVFRAKNCGHAKRPIRSLVSVWCP